MVSFVSLAHAERRRTARAASDLNDIYGDPGPWRPPAAQPRANKMLNFRRLFWPTVCLLIAIALCAFAIYMLALPTRHVYARDLGQWNDQPAEVRQWYQQAQLTPEAQKRFNFVMCCSYAEVVKSQFRVDKINGADHWFYLKDGAWEQIPDDIIHWNESAPDNKPTLFALDRDTLGAKKGDLTCFYPPSGGF